jgi:serine/threonine protein kinase
MSVEARELMTDEWTRWQGHVVNGVFPLGRLLGCSEQSGVFLTRWEEPGHRDVAIKLFPTTPAQTELQLPRWARAGANAHPHLLDLLESGACQLGGLPYLYVVMEYADQTLAQLLTQRALTAEEAREMLVPILEALAYLHRQDLVLGRLKPANVLVVGDQLKMASDTIRSVSESALSVTAPSAYDPPEALAGTSSTADDIWALGVTLFEALTRRTLLGSAGHRSTLVLPADFSPAFRDVVSSCLKPMPQDRPDVTELLAWTRGKPVQPNTVERPQTAAAKVEAPRAVPSVRARKSLRLIGQFPTQHALVVVMLAVAVIFALAWTGVHLFRSQSGPNSLPANSGLEPPNSAQPHAADLAPPTAIPAGGDAIAPLTQHEVMPNVPQSAARTIRGHIKVSVRAIVATDGSVSAAVANRGGASKYFQRLAEEATKKWTFAPTHAASQRLVQVQFEFSRETTTGHAILIH